MPPKVVLVTGAARGIGREISLRLARAGCIVAMHHSLATGASLAAAQATLADVNASTSAPDVVGRHQLFPADFAAVPSSTASLFAAVVDHFGRVDVLVNNAGICEDHAVQDDATTFEQFQRSAEVTMRVNFTAPAELSFLFARHIRQTAAARESTGNNGGRIVNVTSRAAYRGEFTAPVYAASKSALNIFGQSYAKTLAGDTPGSVLVFTVAPGWVKTEMATAALTGPGAAGVLAQHPLGRVAEPEEVGRTVAWLALDAPAAVTGAVVDLNGASYLR